MGADVQVQLFVVSVFCCAVGYSLYYLRSRGLLAAFVNRLSPPRPRHRFRASYRRYHQRHMARLRYKQSIRKHFRKTRRTEYAERQKPRYDTTLTPAQLDILLAWKDQQRRPSRDEMLVLLGIGPNTLNKMLDTHRAKRLVQTARDLPPRTDYPLTFDAENRLIERSA